MAKNLNERLIQNQRAEIVRELTGLLGLAISPAHPDSFYQQEPTDPEYLELYEQAQRDPIRYALLCNIKRTQDVLLERKETATPDEYVNLREDIEDAKYLLQQYDDPLGNPLDRPDQ